jgi:ubiquinone/menaquinone biosynthesis C-methylase UbiE
VIGLSVALIRYENVVAMNRLGDYGYDAPYGLAIFATLGTIGLVVAVVSWWTGSGRLVTPMALYGAFFLANAFCFLHTTRRGKFQVWDEILDELRLRGDERVLDMGCGRGAVLTAVGRRLRAGRATGVDLWSTHDQSGNAPEVTVRNASIEGVRDRIEVRTADMRALPFPDGVFDLVVSSLAIHNIRSNASRAQAVQEAWRVLKPGGRLAVADIRATRHYARTLHMLGAIGVVRRALGWRFWWGNPFASTTLITASKPHRA